MDAPLPDTQAQAAAAETGESGPCIEDGNMPIGWWRATQAQPGGGDLGDEPRSRESAETSSSEGMEAAGREPSSTPDDTAVESGREEATSVALATPDTILMPACDDTADAMPDTEMCKSWAAEEVLWEVPLSVGCLGDFDGSLAAADGGLELDVQEQSEDGCAGSWQGDEEDDWEVHTDEGTPDSSNASWQTDMASRRSHSAPPGLGGVARPRRVAHHGQPPFSTPARPLQAADLAVPSALQPGSAMRSYYFHLGSGRPSNYMRALRKRLRYAHQLTAQVRMSEYCSLPTHLVAISEDALVSGNGPLAVLAPAEAAR